VGASEATLVTSANTVSSPSVASDGTDWLVAWQGWPNGQTVIEAIRISSSGLPIGGLFQASHVNQGAFHPEVTFTGSNYLIIWGDWRSSALSGDDIYGVRVNTSGSVIDASDIKICDAPGDQGSFNNTWRQMGLACDPADKTCFAAWRDTRAKDYDVYGSPLNANGAPPNTSGALITTGANSQQNPSVATDGTNYLVVWEDLRNSGGVTTLTDIYGVLLGASGDPIDAAGIALAINAEEQRDPAVAWNGETYFVAWADKRNGAASGYDIYGARVNAAGVVLDPGGKLISGALGDQVRPSVTSNGTGFFVVWADKRQQDLLTFGARIDAAGNVVDPDGIAIGTEHQQWTAHVTSDGSGYLVAWDDYQGAVKPTDRVYAVRLDDKGQKIDADPIWITSMEESVRTPRVAWNGSEYLVVWNKPMFQTAARVNPNGQILDVPGVHLGTAQNQSEAPGVVWDGYTFLVVWDLKKPSKDRDIAAARMSSEGKVLDVPEVFLASDVSDEKEVAVASAGKGRSLVVFARNIVEGPLGAKRVRGKFVSLGEENAFACTDNGSCNSGWCVDGVCCDAPCGGGDPSDCQACNLDGLEGTCSSVLGGTCDAGGGSMAATGAASGSASSGSAGTGGGGGPLDQPNSGDATSQFACSTGQNSIPSGSAWRLFLVGVAVLLHRSAARDGLPPRRPRSPGARGPSGDQGREPKRTRKNQG
jgi:hypothetical protein